MKPVIDHIQITVKNLEKAEAFYDRLMPISDQFTKAGDLWRSSAVQMAGIYKGRLTEQKDFDNTADIMTEISAIEYNAFKQLVKLNLK